LSGLLLLHWQTKACKVYALSWYKNNYIPATGSEFAINMLISKAKFADSNLALKGKNVLKELKN